MIELMCGMIWSLFDWFFVCEFVCVCVCVCVRERVRVSVCVCACLGVSRRLFGSRLAVVWLGQLARVAGLQLHWLFEDKHHRQTTGVYSSQLFITHTHTRLAQSTPQSVCVAQEQHNTHTHTHTLDWHRQHLQSVCVWHRSSTTHTHTHTLDWHSQHLKVCVCGTGAAQHTHTHTHIKRSKTDGRQQIDSDWLSESQFTSVHLKTLFLHVEDDSESCRGAAHHWI